MGFKTFMSYDVKLVFKLEAILSLSKFFFPFSLCLDGPDYVIENGKPDNEGNLKSDQYQLIAVINSLATFTRIHFAEI